MGWIAVLVMVLKYIGIAILIVLAILIILLLLLLFNSVKYEAKGAYSAEESTANAFVSWLFGLIRFEVSYNGNDFKFNARCPMKKRIQRIIAGKRNKNDDSKPVVKIASVENEKNEPRKKADQEKQHKLKKSAKNKSVVDRLKDAFEKIFYYYNEYDIKHLFSPFKRFLLRFVKSLGLKKMEADITFGFDDPSLTGMVLGGSTAATAFLPFDVNLRGYFDGEYLNGNGYIKGKTCVLRLLMPFIKVILEKPVRNLILKILNSNNNDSI